MVPGAPLYCDRKHVMAVSVLTLLCLDPFSPTLQRIFYYCTSLHHSICHFLAPDIDHGFIATYLCLRSICHFSLPLVYVHFTSRVPWVAQLLSYNCGSSLYRACSLKSYQGTNIITNQHLSIFISNNVSLICNDQQRTT